MKDSLIRKVSSRFLKVSVSKNQLDSVERHLRKYRKEYLHIHDWRVKAEYEIQKIENKQIGKNTKEETDWIRVGFLSRSFVFSFLNFRAQETILKN